MKKMKKSGTLFTKEMANFEKTINAKDREIGKLKKEKEKLISEKMKVKEESLKMVNKERAKFEKILKDKYRELDELKIEIKVLRSEKKENDELFKRFNMERIRFEKSISEFDELKRENEKLKSEKMGKIDKNETMGELNKKVENNDEIMEKGKAKEEQINGVVEEKLLKESEVEKNEKLNNIVNRLKNVMAPVEIEKNNGEKALDEEKINHVAFDETLKELRKKIEDLGKEFETIKSEHEKLKNKELENRNRKAIFQKVRKKRVYTKKWNQVLLCRAIMNLLETKDGMAEKTKCEQEKLIKEKELENQNGKDILQEDILEPEKGEHTQKNGIDCYSEEPSRICWRLEVEPLKNGEGSKDNKALVKDENKKKKKKRF